MDKVIWAEEKEKWRRESLEKHARLSELFRKDRFAFEIERKRRIDEFINSAREEEERRRLRALQDSWDKKMRNAGSRHNRFVLAQSLFWEHFYEVWQQALQQLTSGD
jgi:FKBP-type peptidyl-prolyl cis-trans isomerase (trigger factor)